MPNSTYKILMIDDEPDACLLFKKIVGRWNYKIVTATDAKNGLRLYQKEKPDLVFLDIIMPGTDGLNLLKKINKLNPKQLVIIITGFGDLRSAKTAMKLGAYDYVSKPLDMKALKNSINDALTELRA